MMISTKQLIVDILVHTVLCTRGASLKVEDVAVAVMVRFSLTKFF